MRTVAEIEAAIERLPPAERSELVAWLDEYRAMVSGSDAHFVVCDEGEQDRRATRKMGFVANFCPLCRDIRAFKLVRVGTAPPILGISFGIGSPRADIIECCECGRSLRTEPVAYASFAKKPTLPIESLIEQTYPNLRKLQANRLVLEVRIRHSPGSLTTEERRQLILEPFVLLNPEVEKRFAGNTQMDLESSIGCLGTIMGFVIVFGIGMVVRPWSLQDHWFFASVIVFGIGTTYTLIQAGLSPRRFLRTKILPVIGHSLRPLEPTEVELEACLESCKTGNMIIARKLKLKAILLELRKPASKDRGSCHKEQTLAS